MGFPPNPGKGLGVAGMVLGIVGLVFLWLFYIGIPCALVGLILSAVGYKKSKDAGMPGGMAVAGLVCSIIALAVCIICAIAIAAACGSIGCALGACSI